jgi:hypothetical protein
MQNLMIPETLSFDNDPSIKRFEQLPPGQTDGQNETTEGTLRRGDPSGRLPQAAPCETEEKGKVICDKETPAKLHRYHVEMIKNARNTD